MNVVFTIPIYSSALSGLHLPNLFDSHSASAQSIFTTLGFITAEHQIERTPAHGHHTSNLNH